MTANTPRSRKAKGAKYQTEIKEALMDRFKDKLEEGDIKTAVMGESGSDLILSPAAQRVFPYAVECKRTEKISLRQWWKQAVANSTEKLRPLLFTKQNREETLVVMDLNTFLELLDK